jgi:hypothetical protein
VTRRWVDFECASPGGAERQDLRLIAEDADEAPILSDGRDRRSVGRNASLDAFVDRISREEEVDSREHLSRRK